MVIRLGMELLHSENIMLHPGQSKEAMFSLHVIPDCLILLDQTSFKWLLEISTEPVHLLRKKGGKTARRSVSYMYM